MSVYSTITTLGRLRDQALLADYASDRSKEWHLSEFRLDMLRLLSGHFGTATPLELKQLLRGKILKTLEDAEKPITPAQADVLIAMLISAPISDPLLLRDFSNPVKPAIAAE